ncbi:hypothetical protein SLS62_008995 [Diatrype stigma]|uniref:Uncharacterized protein n=1 Tax=Diatrype stigma TaxID=117547 RepID=A0AAN9UG46_9PEZI
MIPKMGPRATTTAAASSLAGAAVLLNLLLPLLLLLPQPASCAFSLDTVATDVWYYVHNHLADTTSAACLAAYAAPIACDDTLLKLVSSESPNFDPGPDDLARVCAAPCRAALEAYVAGVEAACKLEDGDAALVSANVKPRPRVPVAVVGQIFQYEYAWACSKDSSSWCYLSYPTSGVWARTDFSCDNECATQFFSNAHELPGADYLFSVYTLTERSDWWENQWDEGWEHVLECRDGDDDGGDGDDGGDEGDSSSSSSTSRDNNSSRTSTTSSDDGTPTAASTATTTTATTAATTAATTTTTEPSSTAADATASVASELPTSTSDSAAAGRLRSPFRGIWF